MEVALKDFMYVSNKQGCTQGGVFGVETRLLSLIFYKNFFTCAKEISCFRILFACSFVSFR